MLAALGVIVALAVPPPETPVIVAGQPLSAAAMRKLGDHPVDSRRDQPINHASQDVRVRGADEATEAAWIAGEAQRLGVSADPAEVERAFADERRQWGDRWSEALPPETPDDAHARVARGVLKAAVGRALAARAHTTAGFGRVFDGFHRRWRAVTTCRALWRDPWMDRCGDHAPHGTTCVWMGAADVCGRRGAWFIVYDLSGALHPGNPDLDADDADQALARLHAALPRGVRRRVDMEAEADEQFVDGRRRADLVSAARTILRLVQRSAAGQAIR